MLFNKENYFINCFRKFSQKQIKKWTDREKYMSDSAQMFQYRQDWKAALTGWKNVIVHYPENTNAHIQCGKVLTRMGCFREAEAAFRFAAKRFSDLPGILEGLARISEAQKEYDQACIRWHRASECFPEKLSLRAAHIQSLLNILEFDKAQTLFTEISKKTQDPDFMSVLSDIHAAKYDWSLALDVLRSIRTSVPDKLKILLKEANLLIRYSLNSGKPEYIKEAIVLLEHIDQTFPWKLHHKTKLAQAYIYDNRDDDACRVINKLPGTLNTHMKVMELRAWQCHFCGNEAGAKRIWKDLLQQHYISSVHSPIGFLKRMDNNILTTIQNEILLFCAMRNELWRLPWFIDYYRKIGVDRFIIIDNDSDDGSIDFLLQQKDVHVFWTNDSYGKSSSGMRWINELVEKYGQKSWCLYVDADEALVFPGIEKFGLRHLADYMEQNGHEALFAFMLDMHAHDTIKQLEYQPGDDFSTHYPYFENSYNIYGATHCPYKYVIGGIRRIFENTWSLTKTPFIRGGRNIKFLLSSHQTTPAVISDVTAVLQHYKMAGDFHNRCLDVTSMKTRLPSAKKQHLRSARTIEDLGENYTFVSSLTERFGSSNQLIKLGLINSPDGFLN